MAKVDARRRGAPSRSSAGWSSRVAVVAAAALVVVASVQRSACTFALAPHIQRKLLNPLAERLKNPTYVDLPLKNPATGERKMPSRIAPPKAKQDPIVYQIWYENPEDARKAESELDEAELDGYGVWVTLDRRALNRDGKPFKVSVQGVPQSFEEERVRSFFEKVGPVLQVDRSLDSRFASIWFADPEVVEAASEACYGDRLDGRKMRMQPRYSLMDVREPLDQVLVHGLSPDTTAAQLKTHFEQQGEVRHVYIHGERNARIVYRSAEEARRAVKFLHGTQMPLTSRRIQVSYHWDDSRESGSVVASQLPAQATQDMIREYFSKAGEVVVVNLHESERVPEIFQV